MAVKSAQGCIPSVYKPRDPAKTILYQVVQEHFETYLSLSGEGWEDNPVPAYVEREFRRYLECGILAYGFARARCPECGHDFLVAFSCKGRGVCPSCNARRMAEIAAHLVDHVFPELPVRQWGESRPNVQWTFATRRTTGQDVRAGTRHHGWLKGNLAPVITIYCDRTEKR